jgi:hypothetical protein
MRGTERLQVGHHGRSGVKVEIRRQLQAVGRDRDRRGHFPIRCARAPSTAGRCRPTRCVRSVPAVRFGITAAADTSPASGLMPASSTPATAWRVSERSILRSRCPSDRFSKRRFASDARSARSRAGRQIRRSAPSVCPPCLYQASWRDQQGRLVGAATLFLIPRRSVSPVLNC